MIERLQHFASSTEPGITLAEGEFYFPSYGIKRMGEDWTGVYLTGRGTTPGHLAARGKLEPIPPVFSVDLRERLYNIPACNRTARIKDMPSRKILVAEDNPDDAFIFKMMFKRATLPHTLYMVDDGQKVIDWLSGHGDYADREKYPMPDMVLLDLKMPEKTGFETLEWIRARQEFEQLQVIILSSSDDQIDVKRAYQMGITTYFVKSPHLQDVMYYLRMS